LTHDDLVCCKIVWGNSILGRNGPEGKWLNVVLRLGKMSIESLMSAADAAGYVMAAEDELPDTFGRKPSLFDFKSLPPTSLAIWRPIVPSADGQSSAIQAHASTAWNWVAGRFHTGATA
jgi:hypothetical protein